MSIYHGTPLGKFPKLEGMDKRNNEPVACLSYIVWNLFEINYCHRKVVCRHLLTDLFIYLTVCIFYTINCPFLFIFLSPVPFSFFSFKEWSYAHFMYFISPIWLANYKYSQVYTLWRERPWWSISLHIEQRSKK